MTAATTGTGDDQLGETLPAGIPDDVAARATYTVGAAVAAADDLPTATAEALRTVAAEAFTAGM